MIVMGALSAAKASSWPSYIASSASAVGQVSRSANLADEYSVIWAAAFVNLIFQVAITAIVYGVWSLRFAISNPEVERPCRASGGT